MTQNKFLMHMQEFRTNEEIVSFRSKLKQELFQEKLLICGSKMSNQDKVRAIIRRLQIKLHITKSRMV